MFLRVFTKVKPPWDNHHLRENDVCFPFFQASKSRKSNFSCEISDGTGESWEVASAYPKGKGNDRGLEGAGVVKKGRHP